MVRHAKPVLDVAFVPGGEEPVACHAAAVEQ